MQQSCMPTSDLVHIWAKKTLVANGFFVDKNCDCGSLVNNSVSGSAVERRRRSDAFFEPVFVYSTMNYTVSKKKVSHYVFVMLCTKVWWFW